MAKMKKTEMAEALTFPLDDRILAIARHSIAGPEWTYGYDVLCDERYHLNRTIKEKDGWPDKDNIDPSTLSPAMMLVKDQGIYLMGNALPEMSKEGHRHVAYASEADPTKMAFDDWWDTARRIMGGDDTVITMFGLPQALVTAHAQGKKSLVIKVTPNELRYYCV